MRIISSKDIGHDQLKILVFGRSGAGKTTLCASADEKTLIISAESGLLSISHTSVDVVELNTDDAGNIIPRDKRIHRLMEVYKFLLTDEAKKKYKWVCLDSLTEIGQNLVEKFQAEYTDRKDALVLWGEYAKSMRGLIKAFRDLPGYNVVFTALAIEEKDENGIRSMAIDLNGKISQQLPQFFDEVLYLFTKKNEQGEVKRFLLCSPNEAVPYAKDRSGKLPHIIEEPKLSFVSKQIKSNKGEKK